ncbi:AraC-like DNA-binding protein/quercetin dioxygenase-like cupin family protein [Lachnospiraceae bacterium PF1-21]|uniref:AraC family transcriptional regulator n=1 Tax=Ohessyouella blattaphilus TaxID=2949333 RepID=A0ABT1EF16_9FIRM|nr:AraC family transcriptional regulator [Ohessyouella blattaphilus]MCP1109312.1 AraC family transcriptional regulator [Ohessyouella blattaphilus]MCR8562706.1 AraC family transcriptional regulator [Ohessyouella blattaphilus]MDL2249971.1 AraC family transcriptional regulator [Lachnospiraceae bacterium OttesenSCG-928-J05]
MAYEGVTLKSSINLGKIYSIHYFEYMSDFSFEGESHDFWEFICVDKGEVGVRFGDDFKILKRGEIAFHPPNEFHNVKATGEIAPNLVVISFDCHDKVLDFFRHKTLRIDETERNLLADIIIEARRCFDCRLDDPYLQNMPQKDPDAFGAEQLININLHHFLIHLIRRYSNPIVIRKKLPTAVPIKTTKKKSDMETFNRIVDYLEENLSSHLTIEKICQDNLIGRALLQRIFKEQTSLGIIEYFSHMKILAAKQMIRTNQMNFTQIAECMGYTSIHYFSRQFKQIAGMTPSDYASSIKAMAEGTF